MRIHLVLAALILLAGCTGGGGSLPTTGGGTGTKPDGGGTKSTSNEISVYFTGLPEEVSDTTYFTIAAEASDDISDAKVFVYNLGSYLESSCSGTSSFGDMYAGQKKEISCSIKARDTPLETIDQEILYESSYKISKYTGQVGFKIYDSDEYDRVNPSEGEVSADLGLGNVKVNPENAREGESISIELELGGDLATGETCNCNVEKITLKIPRGFSVTGDSGWTKSTCSNFNCYEKRNINVPLVEDLILTIAGVTKTETFYIGVEVEGIWKIIRGTDTVTILAN